MYQNFLSHYNVQYVFMTSGVHAILNLPYKATVLMHFCWVVIASQFAWSIVYIETKDIVGPSSVKYFIKLLILVKTFMA